MKKIFLLGAMVCALFASCGKNNDKPVEEWTCEGPGYNIRLVVNPNTNKMHSYITNSGEHQIVFEDNENYSYSWSGNSMIMIEPIGEFSVTDSSTRGLPMKVLSYTGNLPYDLLSVRVYPFMVEQRLDE